MNQLTICIPRFLVCRHENPQNGIMLLSLFCSLHYLQCYLSTFQMQMAFLQWKVWVILHNRTESDNETASVT